VKVLAVGGAPAGADGERYAHYWADDMTIVRKRLLVFLALISLSGLLGQVFADHCPDELMMSGKPDHKLAGVDIYEDRIDRVLQIYGAPTEHREDTEDPSYPPGSGEGEYAWTFQGASLKVLTGFYVNEKGKRVESVASVQVGGMKAPLSLRTGRGIGLGDPLDKVEKLYGAKYLKGSLFSSGPDSSTITFCFEDETVLEFVLTPDRKVKQIFLAPHE